MRFVELKSQDQLDMQTLHRSRDRLVGERTALIDQLRAILLERGMVAPQGKRKLAVPHRSHGRARRSRLEPADHSVGRGRPHAMGGARSADRRLRRRVTRRPRKSGAPPVATIPVVGAIIASALVAAVGHAESFERGRDLAAWLGLVRGSSPPAASRSCWGSASAATDICAGS